VGRGPRRDDCGGVAGQGRGVEARAVEEVEDPGEEVDLLTPFLDTYLLIRIWS